MRWSQLGFGRTATTSRSQDTPRNLMGMKDGTANIQRRGHRRRWTASSGSAARPGLDARRQLPGHPPDPDAARGLGPLLARRPGADDRPRTSTAARRSAAARSSTRSTSTPRRDGAAGDPGRRPRPPRLGAGKRRRADPAPRLLLHRRRRREPRRARSRPLLHRLPARPGEAVRRDPAPARLHDALNEYIKHVGSAVFAVPPGRRRAATSAKRCSAEPYSDSFLSVFVRVP